MNSLLVRIGKREDLPRVLELIRELALYERAPQEVINTVEQMEKDGFGPSPVYGFFVAEDASAIVGISIYYYRYSTWKGKRLYLEDIVVTAAHRGRGIGKMLFERILRKSLSENCSGVAWQVLEWNKPAIDFYKKYYAKLDYEWTNGSLEAEQIRKLLAD